MSNQARYWLLTIPHADFLPYQPPGVVWIRGQLESGGSTGFLHWQLFATFAKKQRLAGVKSVFGNTCHAEPSRSTAAEEYVFKDTTAVANTRFELGSKPIQRNNAKDWERIRELARSGRLEDIPGILYINHRYFYAIGDIYIRNYSNLKRIAVDNAVAIEQEREVYVFWGKSGTGKSRRAWAEAGNTPFLSLNPN